jgi:hypothetical protein
MVMVKRFEAPQHRCFLVEIFPVAIWPLNPISRSEWRRSSLTALNEDIIARFPDTLPRIHSLLVGGSREQGFCQTTQPGPIVFQDRVGLPILLENDRGLGLRVKDHLSER